MRVSIETQGLGLAERELSMLGARATNLRPVFSRIGRDLLSAQRTQFASGRGWRRLAASTRKRKARQGLDPRRNVATGALERALTSASAVRVGRDELRYGVGGAQFYARFLQSGTKTAPKRPVVRLRPVQRREVRERIEDYVIRGRS